MTLRCPSRGRPDREGIRGVLVGSVPSQKRSEVRDSSSVVKIGVVLDQPVRLIESAFGASRKWSVTVSFCDPKRRRPVPGTGQKGRSSPSSSVPLSVDTPLFRFYIQCYGLYLNPSLYEIRLSVCVDGVPPLLYTFSSEVFQDCYSEGQDYSPCDPREFKQTPDLNPEG